MALICQHLHCLSEITMIHSYSCDFSSWVTGVTAWVQTSWVPTLWSPSVRWLCLAWRGEVWSCIWFSTVELLLLTLLCPHSHLTTWQPVCQVVFSAVTVSTWEFPLSVLVGDVWIISYSEWNVSLSVLFGKKEHATEIFEIFLLVDC